MANVTYEGMFLLDSNKYAANPTGIAGEVQALLERVGAKEEDCEGLVNYALSIGDVEVAVFFRELPGGRFRVSLRSKGKLDVASIAEEFGGGGHACASGCSVDGPLHSAVESAMGKIRADPAKTVGSG